MEEQTRNTLNDNIYCEHCGTKNGNNFNFCLNCGKSLRNLNEQSIVSNNYDINVQNNESNNVSNMADNIANYISNKNVKDVLYNKIDDINDDNKNNSLNNVQENPLNNEQSNIQNDIEVFENKHTVEMNVVSDNPKFGLLSIVGIVVLLLLGILGISFLVIMMIICIFDQSSRAYAIKVLNAIGRIGSFIILLGLILFGACLGLFALG